MATDPNIILAAGQINDPARLAQSQMLQMQAQQMQQAQHGQNALRQVFAQPGAMTPDGQVSQNALAQVMKVDPQTGMELAKQNRAAMLDALHIKAAELGNKMSETEIGKAKWEWMTDIAAATTDAYENAIKGGADQQRALAAATATRDKMLDSNGGQMSEEEENAAKSRPLNIDEARAMAAQNKTWQAGKKEDERFAETVRMDNETVKDDRERIDLEKRRINDEESEYKPLGSTGYVTRNGKVIDPDSLTPGGATYTGGLTPRKANGGDNPDEIVDKKIDFIASKLGVNPDEKLTPQQLLAFRSAYIQTEGSKTNNVGNLKNVSGAGFQSFPTKDAGMAAITAQISRDYARGQTSIRQLIEGTPTGGGGKDDSLAKSIAEYNVALPARLISTARGQKIMQKVLALNPDYDQTKYDEKKKFVVGLGSTQTGTAGGRILATNTVMQHISLLDQLARQMNNGNIPAANSIKNWFSKNTGSPDVTNFNLAKQFVVNETLKAAAGGVLTGEDRQTMLSNISASGSWRQLSEALGEMQTLVGAQAGSLKRQYRETTGKNDFDRYLSPATKEVLKRTMPEDFADAQSKPTVSGW